METLGQRIKRLREERGMDQVTLAKKVGFSQPALAKLESGRNERSRFLAEIARELDTSVEWLTSGKDEPDSAAPRSEIEEAYNPKEPFSNVAGIRRVDVIEEGSEPPGVVRIRKVRLRLSAGIVGFGIEQEIEDGNPIYFRDDWLRDRGYSRDNLLALPVRGHSMEPGLYDGDTVVVNLADTKPKDGDVFAVNYEGEDVIKRLVREMGHWWLVSDNPDQRRYSRKQCANEMCIIIGKVIHKQSERI